MLHCVLFSLFSVLLKPVVAQLTTTLYGIEPAFEGEFLTEPFQSTSIGVGTDGVITVVDHAATDRILAHGTYGVTLKESSNGLVFDASGTVYHEHMSCALDTRAALASCVFSQSIGGSTVIGTFTPTVLPVVAVITTALTSPSTPTSSLQTSSTPSQTSASSNNGGSGLSSGALAGIIVAIVLAVIVLLGLIFWLVVLRRRRHRVMQETEAMHEDVERQDHNRITPFVAPSAITPGLTSPNQPSSPQSPSAYESNSSSGMSEKRRMFFAANNNIDQPGSPPPNSFETRSAVQSTDTRWTPSEYSQSNTGSDVDARRILDEMRRMRAEVAELRTQAIPPEYSE